MGPEMILARGHPPEPGSDARWSEVAFYLDRIPARMTSYGALSIRLSTFLSQV